MGTLVREAGDRVASPGGIAPKEGESGPDRAIAGTGTPESAWQAWPPLAHVPALPLDTLGRPGRRTVVVAPHPDDEVLGCGGALYELASRGIECCVIAVTDGAASHPGSACWPPAALAERRREESMAGLSCFGLGTACRVALGIDDGAVASACPALAERLATLLRPSDTVLSTWRLDGHPDHDATGAATAAACRHVGCVHLEVPIWMWHWAVPGDARVPWHRLRRWPMSAAAAEAKAAAVAAHATQLTPQDTGAPAVLPEWALARLLRPCEYVFVDGAAASAAQTGKST